MAATVLKSTSRGSAELYLLLARSVRDEDVAVLGDDLDLSLIALEPGHEVPGRVGHLAVAGDADGVAADEGGRPPLTPAIGVTPISASASPALATPARLAGIGMMPMLPLGK